jgi:hypothetical protein
MASQVQELKSALNGYAGETTGQAQALRSSLRGYDKSAQRILALIGGSSSGKDREVAAKVREARAKIEQAAQALQQASQAAKSYGGSL